MIFLCFGSPLAHLEPELELFEVWDDGEDDLSHHFLSSADLMLDICSYFFKSGRTYCTKGRLKKLVTTDLILKA